MKLSTLLYVFTVAAVPSGALAGPCGLSIADKANGGNSNQKRPVDLSALPSSCDAGEEVIVTMPNGRKKAFRKTQGLASSRSFHGQDVHGSSFQYIRDENDHIFGSLVDVKENTVSQFKHDALGNEIVVTRSTSEFPDEDDPDEDEEGRRSLRGSTKNVFKTQESARSDGSRELVDDGSFLDVMVVWTSEAECKRSELNVGCTKSSITENNMIQLIELAVDETNKAYEMSGVSTRLRLVHSQHIEYTETNDPYRDALSQIRSTSDGIMDEVHSLRAQYRADLVAMIIGSGGSCGRATLGPYFEGMFSVTNQDCATGYFSFGHGKF